MKQALMWILVLVAHNEAQADIAQVWRAQELQHLQELRFKSEQADVLNQACRLQQERRLPPVACLKARHSVRSVARACRAASFEATSLSALRQALALKGWDQACRARMLHWEERKIYQAEDEQLGASFENEVVDETDSATQASDL